MRLYESNAVGALFMQDGRRTNAMKGVSVENSPTELTRNSALLPPCVKEEYSGS